MRHVENDPTFQKIDVDLIVTDGPGSYRVEIKGDRWHTTGNFFFETHSNRERGTLGCFMYTQADGIFYYFVVPRTQYLLPMTVTRDWFVENINRFQERSTRTPVRGGDYYTTVGRLVPVRDVLREVQGVRVEQL